MYVCICNAVTESDVREAVRQGVRSLRVLASETGCGTNCGRCARTAAEVLKESLGSVPELSIVSDSRAA
jgi:bacterioferritin-associated ferredoxin